MAIVEVQVQVPTETFQAQPRASQMSFEAHDAGQRVSKEIALDLRPYQLECLAAVDRLHQTEGENRLIAQLATGGGKTIIFSALTAERKTKTLILAHRDELLSQAIAKLRMVYPHADIGRVQADCNEVGHEITVSSVQTLYREGRFKQAFPDPARLGLLITDESHHVAAMTYKAIFERFGLMTPRAPGAALHLGVTATPIRGDKLSLGEVYDRFAYKWSIKDGIKQGYLCDLTGYTVAINNESFGDVHVRGGDYDAGELHDAVSVNVARNEAIVQAWQERAHREAPYNEQMRPTVVFCLDIEHAESVAETFSKAGVKAGVVHSQMHIKERRLTLAKYEAGDIKVLANCMVLTEGWDSPRTECVVMARPTRNQSLYIQCLDAETEILTARGWKKHHEVEKGELVAAFNMDNQCVELWPALNKYVRPLGDGEEMYSINSPSLDIRVTGGHRMVYRVREGRKHIKSNWRFATAEELAKRTYEYEIPIAGHNNTPGVRLTDDELRFIGWFLTDGTINRITGQIIIYQAAHQPHNEAIVSMLKGCGFKYGVHEVVPDTQYNANSNGLRYCISKGQPRGKNKDLSGWGRLEPYIDKNLSSMLQAVNKRQLGVLLEAIHLGDGHKQNGQDWEQGSYHIFTGNKIFAERLQSLCIRLGYKCNLTKINREDKEYYTLHIKDTTFRTIGGNTAKDRPILGKTETIPGELVWCVENKLSTLVIRRNGKVAIVGNCVGRGTRLFPQGGKRNCLILDVADIAGKVSVNIRPQTLERALELVPEGQEHRETESVKEFWENEDGGDGGNGGRERVFADARGGKNFNPLADPFEDNPLLKLRWTVGGSGLTLSLPKKLENSRHFIVVKRRKDLLFDVVHIKQQKEFNNGGFEQWRTAGEKFVNEHGLPDESAAALFAEKYAENICPEIAKRARSKFERMNDYSASQKQIELLAKKKLPVEIGGRRVTMAQASAMLDSVFAGKVKARIERQASELDIY